MDSHLHAVLLQVMIALPSQTPAASPSIMYCTNTGVLGQASWPDKAVADWQTTASVQIPAEHIIPIKRPKPSSICDVIFQENSGLASFDIHAGLHQEVYCLTGQEGLLHVRI